MTQTCAATHSNIFRFATKELSQDAFLCWLIDSARFPANQALERCGQAFVRLLCEKAGKLTDDSAAISVREEPLRQFLHTDILFLAEVGGRELVFVIEDKVNAGTHGRQLETYKRDVLEKLRAERPELRATEDDCVFIYLKTGYLFEDGQEAARHAYTVVSADELLDFLDRHHVQHDVYADFREYLRERVETRGEQSTRLRNDEVASLGNAHVQWELLHHLATRCQDDLPTAVIYRGTSFGRPWTQLRFLTQEGVLQDDVTESLFYRLDSRKGGHYLSLRQYAYVADSDKAKEKKRERLEQFRKAFAKAAHAVLELQLGNESQRGTFENEVGVVFFSDEGPNRISTVLAHWPRVQKAFLENIQRAGLYTPSLEDS